MTAGIGRLRMNLSLLILNIRVKWLLLLSEYTVVEGIIALLELLMASRLISKVKANAIFVVERDLVLVVHLSLQLTNQRVDELAQILRLYPLYLVCLITVLVQFILVQEGVIFILSLPYLLQHSILELLD